MKNWYSITNKSETEAEISIYDEIGMWGISARDFLNEMRGVGNRRIILRINSPGGEVFDGIAIYNRLREHAAGVEVRIDGIAASMASVIAMAGTPIKMAENALMMIHNPSGICAGGSDDMRDLADLLDKIKGALITAYENKTGRGSDEITAMMDAETWLDAKECKAMGFIDEVTCPNKIAASFGRLKASARLDAREKGIDSANADVTTNDIMQATQTTEQPSEAIIAEAVAAAVVTNTAEVKATTLKDERERIESIRAWAVAVASVQNINLDEATDAFINDGKSLAEFRDHVITNTFKAKPLANATDSNGSDGKRLTRSEFGTLTPFNQSDFCRNGGRITD